MKFLPLLAVGLFFVVVSAKDKEEEKDKEKKMDKEEAKNMFRSMSEECKVQEKATDDDVEMMVNENYPESREGKCLIACMQETFGIVQDGKFNMDGFMGIAGMAAGNDDKKLRQAEEIGEECKTVSHQDRCEQAIEIGKCMEEGAKKRNMTADRK